MSIDEMIKVLTESEVEFGDRWIEKEQCEKIAAALRAAEQIRLTAQQMSEDGYRLSASFEVALETFDEAAQEDRE
jgi:GGDEF domain-containing protein